MAVVRRAKGNLRFPLDKTYHGCPRNIFKFLENSVIAFAGSYGTITNICIGLIIVISINYENNIWFRFLDCRVMDYIGCYLMAFIFGNSFSSLIVLEYFQSFRLILYTYF